MRIKADDTNTYAPGTVITDDDGLTIVARGTVRLSERSATYQVRETTFKQTGRTETNLIGPRGSIYILHPYSRTEDGVFRAISFGSGTVLTRQGNEVLFIRLGDMIEPTSRNAVTESARVRRAAERAIR